MSRSISRADLGALKFQTRPEDAGQIVAVSYAAWGEMGCVRMTHDRSDPVGPSYDVAEWSTRPGAVFEPWNGSLGVRGSTWRRLRVRP